MRSILYAIPLVLISGTAMATSLGSPSSVATAGAEQLQGQAQGQLQGQIQGQALSTRQLNEQSLRNTTTATGGVGVGYGGEGGAGGIATSTAAGGKADSYAAPYTSVDSKSESKLLTLAPAALTAGVNPCAVSVSAAGGAGMVGGALGVSWSDSDCNRRANAATLAGLGLTRSAQSLMCLDKDVKAAMVAAGEGCGE